MNETHPAAAPALHDIRAELERIYAEGRIVGDSGKVFEPFPTGMSREAGQALRSLVERETATKSAEDVRGGGEGGGAFRTIETGLAFGLSTLFILDGSLARDRANEADGPVHTAIDPFQATDWDNAALRTLRACGADHLVEFIPEDSLLALPRLAAEGRRYDLALVDGGHHFENAFIDTYYMHRLVRPGGLIIVDDLWMPAVRAAVRYFVTNLGSTLETLPDDPAAKRFAILRTPTPPAAPKRRWDHFVDFQTA